MSRTRTLYGGSRKGGASHQARDMIGIARIPAQQAMAPQHPEIPRFAHRSGRGPLGIDRVIRIGCVLLEVDRELVDLDRREAGNRDIETFHDQDLSQGGQLDCQALAVPAGIFPDLVVGKREGAPLGFRQPLYLDCRDLLEIEQLCRCVSRPCPAIMTPSSSIRSGTTKPNAAMLSAI
jgi:hypothetical protein